MMTEQGMADVTRSVTVDVSAPDAFWWFVRNPLRWLPPAHTFLPEARGLTLGEGVGAEFTEHGPDGARAVRGTILDWAPPHRLAMTWRVGADWRPLPDDTAASHVRIEFVPAGDARSTVVLTHTRFDRLGPAGGRLRAAIDRSGVGETLARFAENVGR